MLRTTLAVLLLVSCALGKRIAFQDCGKGEVKWVDVEPCTSEPCIFKKGQTVTIQAHLAANQDTSAGTLTATVNLDGDDVPLPNVETDICKIVNCPIKQGEERTVSYSLEIEDFFYEMTTTMRWEATGDKGQLFCASSVAGIKE